MVTEGMQGPLNIAILAWAISVTIIPASVDNDPAIRSTYADILRRMSDVVESQKMDETLLDMCNAFLKAYMEIMKNRERERLGM